MMRRKGGLCWNTVPTKVCSTILHRPGLPNQSTKFCSCMDTYAIYIYICLCVLIYIYIYGGYVHLRVGLGVGFRNNLCAAFEKKAEG